MEWFVVEEGRNGVSQRHIIHPVALADLRFLSGS